MIVEWSHTIAEVSVLFRCRKVLFSMPAPDFIPTSDTDFIQWSANFFTVLNYGYPI